jgi:hypothetical protein
MSRGLSGLLLLFGLKAGGTVAAHVYPYHRRCPSGESGCFIAVLRPECADHLAAFGRGLCLRQQRLVTRDAGG